VARAEETLSEAAGQLVHDVNNPLAAASMALELARDEVEDALVAQLLDRAVNSTSRMKRMVTDLLAFAAPSGEGASSLREVLEPLGQEFVGLGPDAVGVPSNDAVVALRRGDLELVLVALLDNCVKFAEDGTPARVEVTLDVETGRARVTVADAGRGIAQADRERVFVPTVRRLFESAGGSVGIADSCLGGVAVWFELPVVPVGNGR
jgi:signal transduction histidine kinase